MPLFDRVKKEIGEAADKVDDVVDAVVDKVDDVVDDVVDEVRMMLAKRLRLLSAMQRIVTTIRASQKSRIYATGAIIRLGRLIGDKCRYGLIRRWGTTCCYRR